MIPEASPVIVPGTPALKDPDVLFKASPKQQEFLDAVFSGEYRVVMYGGAIRGGKTYAGLGALLLLCKFYPGSIWAIVRATQTVTFRNGSQIIFWSENYDDDKDLDRWKGLEVNGFVLEEANELSEDAFWKAIERAGSYIPRSGTKPPPIVMMTCNPATNWVKTLIYDRWAGVPEAGPLPDKWLYIPSKITDNPYAMEDEMYIASINEMPEYKRRVYVEGDWDVQLKIGGEYFKCFDLDLHTAPAAKVEYDPSLPLHISWDDNLNPYLPAGIFQIHIVTMTVDSTLNGKPIKKSIDYFTVKMIDEIVGKTPSNTVPANCKEIIRKFSSHRGGIFIYGDATAKKDDTKQENGFNFYSMIQRDLRAHFGGAVELKVMTSNPAVYLRANWMNTIFENEVGNIKMVISDKCKTAVNDFIGCKEDENGGKSKKSVTDPKTKVSYQPFGHFCDLLEYFMVSRFSTQFANYQAGGAVSSITYGRNTHSKNSYK
jgi:hypothetical protein